MNLVISLVYSLYIYIHIDIYIHIELIVGLNICVTSCFVKEQKPGLVVLLGVMICGISVCNSAKPFEMS